MIDEFANRSESEPPRPVMPFPGMDPYLEHPVLWEGVHTRLIVEMGNQLSPKLLPRYVVSIEERTYIEIPEHQRKPDLWVQQESEEPVGMASEAGAVVASPVVVEVPALEIKERYIEILDRYQEMKVVTVLELLSPSNKKPGPGRDSYLQKQSATLQSEAHLVEIDLLRHGQHTLAVPEFKLPEERPFDYLISVNRWPRRNRYELYPVRLREGLPKFGIPLADPDPDVPLDLQAALDRSYEGGSYMLRVQYDEPCVPPLDADDQGWATECWREYRTARRDLFPEDEG